MNTQNVAQHPEVSEMIDKVGSDKDVVAQAEQALKELTRNVQLDRRNCFLKGMTVGIWTSVAILAVTKIIIAVR